MTQTPIEELQRTIQGFIVEQEGKRQLRMAAGALSSPAVKTLIETYLAQPEEIFLLDQPSAPEIRGQAVHVSGRKTRLLGMDAAWVEVWFDLADQGRPSMLLRFAPTDPHQGGAAEEWNLGRSVAAWSGDDCVLAKLKFADPAFYFSSIPRPAEGDRPQLTAAMHFSAARLLPSPGIGVLEGLVGCVFSRFNGAIQGFPEKPLMVLESAPLMAVKIDYLQLPLTLRAVSAPEEESDMVSSQPSQVETYLEMRSEIRIGGESAPRLPLGVRFGGGGDMLSFRAELQEISSYAVTAFAELLNNTPIAEHVKPVIDIGRIVQLKKLDVHVCTKPLGLAAIGLSLGTSAPLTVVENYLVIQRVDASFMVNHPLKSPKITAILSGDFTFLDEIQAQASAVFPAMRFSGGLKSGTKVELDRLFQRFLPGVGFVPPITLEQLRLFAELKEHNYGMKIGLSSTWEIPLGIARFRLKETDMELEYRQGDTAAKGFSGSLSAVAVLYSNEGERIAEFYAAWVLPADFTLRGTFPEIPLSRLAKTLTGGFLPATEGWPEITLRDSVVELRIKRESDAVVLADETTVYDLRLSTNIEVEKIGKAALFFEVRRKTALGFVAGLVVQPTWNPAQLWSGLETVFRYVQLQEAGLVLSSLEETDFSLPEMKIPWVPKHVRPGITFFASLLLEGEVFSMLGELFSGDITLQFYAYIDVKNLLKSEITAKLPASSGKGMVQFNELEVYFKAGALTFGLKGGATLRLFSEELTISGVGEVSCKPPALSMALSVANWKNPLGIPGLTIDVFGFSMAGGSAGFTVGLMGSFVIGEGTRAFLFKIGGTLIDFQVPGGMVFALDSAGAPKRLLISDMIMQFVPMLPLDKVPLIKDLGFNKLDFYLVVDPSGWLAPDGNKYAAGIGVNADIAFQQWAVIFQTEISDKKGIKANGEISAPIVIPDLLSISDFSGKKGPHLAIDTSSLMPGNEEFVETDPDLAVTGIDRLTLHTRGNAATTYFSASGRIQGLGLDERFSGEVTDEGFDINFFYNLASLFRAEFLCSFSMAKGFHGKADGHFDFTLDLPDGFSLGGVRLIPPLKIVGPQATLFIECKLSLSAAWLNATIDFHWGSFHFHHEIHWDAAQLKDLLVDLWQRLMKWIKENLETFVMPILQDVKAYVEAIAGGVLKLGQSALEIAKALYHYFQVKDIRELAKKLVDIGWLSYQEMVKALMTVFQVTIDTAGKIISELMQICPVTSNNTVLKSGDE